MQDVAAILMASGFSSRFGAENKLTKHFNGRPLAEYALGLAAGLPFGRVILVAADAEVAALAQPYKGVQVVHNPHAAEGQRASIRLGVEAAADAQHFLFLPCDQPFLDDSTLESILSQRQKGRMVFPAYNGKPGSPGLFSASFAPELTALQEGENARILRTRHPEALHLVPIASPLPLLDIDTPEAWKQAEAPANKS